jgi:hypothetical protein
VEAPALSVLDQIGEEALARVRDLGNLIAIEDRLTQDVTVPFDRLSL